MLAGVLEKRRQVKEQWKMKGTNRAAVAPVVAFGGAVQPDPVMGAGFRPVRTLWEGDGAPYPSEQSARWALRQMQSELAQDGALALHRGMLWVNRDKFAELARQRAVSAAMRRYTGGAQF